MRKKNCKITIEYTSDDSLFKNAGKIKKVYSFNDYRICYAVMNLLDCVNSKWIRKEFYNDL